MSNLAITNRPTTFGEVHGQDEAVKLLKGMIINRKFLTKAIVLSGPYGNGKTTLARIFARALLCTHEHPDESEPCDQCRLASFEQLWEFNSADFGEEKQEKLSTILNHASVMRIIIFDEAHLLPKAQQSALLKPLEESDDLAVFLFCTTDVTQLLDALRSRCFDIRLELLSEEALVACLRDNRTKSTVNISDEALDAMARHYLGHARDAITGLQRMAILCGERAITLKDVEDEIGIPTAETALDLFSALMNEHAGNIESTLRTLLRQLDIYLVPAYLRTIWADVIRISFGDMPAHIPTSSIGRYRTLGQASQADGKIWRLSRILCDPHLDGMSTAEQLLLFLYWARSALA